MTRRPEDLGKMGESYVKLLAKDAGLVANGSDDDKAGWDLELESPNPTTIDYGKQSRAVYRVQVKSTTGKGPSISQTFSSLLSLVQFGGPAFIILLRFGEQPHPEQICVLHVDREVGTEILTELRKRQVSDPDLAPNKAKMTLRFPDSTLLKARTGAELKTHLEHCLGEPYANYCKAKTEWLQEIERDSQRLRFNILFEGQEDVQAMADCLLGFERSFKVSALQYTAPMGIPSGGLEHKSDFQSSTIRPIVEQLPRAVVRLRTDEYGPAYEFGAVLYVVPAHMPAEVAAVRIHTSMFDIVYRQQGQKLEFSSANLADDLLRVSVKELRGFVKYMSEARTRDLTYVQVIPNDGKAPLSVSFGTSDVGLPADFDDILAMVETLFMRLSSLNLVEELMRPADLFDKRDHIGFLGHVGSTYDPALTFEFQSDEATLEKAEVVVFCAPIALQASTVLSFGAFFGEVEALGAGNFLGKFDRSELLGEVVVPVTADVRAAKKTCGDRFQEQLRARGLVVL